MKRLFKIGKSRVAAAVLIALTCLQLPLHAQNSADSSTLGNVALPAISDSLQQDTVIDQTIFLDVYYNIIQGNCAVPACHDGNFEPNFLTPQSFYYTTVLHPVLKNSDDNSFKYRLTPFDTTGSILYERITNCCFIDTNDRMPILMPPLSEDEIGKIAEWIMSGTPNWDDDLSWKQKTEQD